MGVPRFKKLPNDPSKEKNIYAYNTKNYPEFQSLPSSTSEKFETLTKVETFPSETDISDIDLKGHTVEELAAAANVDREVILSAIKIRRQQMMLEKKNQNKIPMIAEKKYTTSKQVTYPLETTLSTTKIETSTYSPTTKFKPTTPATLTFVTKKKLKKHSPNGSHKVQTNLIELF